jgi:glutamate formiminotransferase / 5-formyltetrahydrofolate cyclo-ligase
MERLVECVPNISEGRDRSTMDAVAAAVEGTPGVTLLDRTSDRDHHRSVLTFAGPDGDVSRAMAAAADEAIARIDMRVHAGGHPRLGAVDVVPFVPLGDTPMARCVELARAFAADLAERHAMPVFLYAEAATRPERRVLADIRRPQFEGLGEALARPGGEPDFGPRRAHPTAGAAVVGARPFLIAWNIDLASDDRAVARRIAGAVRERDGGLPRVQALGLLLEDRGRAQVSMNLLDHAVTPLWRVWETVARLAEAADVAVVESELIGLAPLQAFLDVADHLGMPASAPLEARVSEAAKWLRIRGFRPDMALELRLAALASRTTRPGRDAAVDATGP